MLVLLSFLSNTAFNFAIGLLLARFLGPDQYGRFALAVACGVVLQTIVFDWARLASARFYSERIAAESPGLRTTIDAMMLGGAAVLAAATIAFLASGLQSSLEASLAALAVTAAVVNGGFDYWTALVRARFLDRVYARLILSKNGLSMVLTLGAAFWYRSAAAALLGLCLSMVGSALWIRRDVKPASGSRTAPDRVVARRLLAYALPIVVANLLYQTIPLVDRLLIARQNGFAQSGQFSLAYDIGLRVVSAIGSALDVFLFQIAVRADELHGAPRAKQQIAENIGIVIAVLTPACMGLWIVMPAFEALVVPPDFQGPFAAYLRLLLPGLFCYGLIFFALHPLFQIGKRTAPLIAAAAIASGVNLAGVALLPAGAGASAYAQIQVGALASALACLVVWGLKTSPIWPRARDLAGVGVATSAMAAATTAVSGFGAGPLALATQVCVGVSVYGAAAYAFDVCHMRRRLSEVMGGTSAREPSTVPPPE